jgi:glucan phosphoethanolaminetransferase (alkaline phosphatase superfamily)
MLLLGIRHLVVAFNYVQLIKFNYQFHLIEACLSISISSYWILITYQLIDCFTTLASTHIAPISKNKIIMKIIFIVCFPFLQPVLTIVTIKMQNNSSSLTVRAWLACSRLILQVADRCMQDSSLLAEFCPLGILYFL